MPWTRAINYSINFYHSSTRYFICPVANFHFRLQFFTVIDELYYHNKERGATYAASSGPKAKASAQRNGTIDEASVF